MVANPITRRNTLRAVGAAGVAGLAGCIGGQGTQTDENVSGTVKIGVLQPLAGTIGYYGKQAIWGFFSGLAHRAGDDPMAKSNASEGTYSYDVDDVTYELHVRDTGFAAKPAKNAATDLVSSTGVDMLFGCSSSGAARRVIDQVVKQSGTPYMAGPAASAGITSNSGTCRENVFRANENTAMDARSGGKYVANQDDVNSVYLFGADYSFGKAVVNNYEQVLKDQGVSIAGKKFVPPKHKEWKGLLDNAKEAGADGIVAGFTVNTLPPLFTTYLRGDYDYRVFGGYATQITNNVVGGILQKELGKPLTKKKIQNANFGPFTSRYHWNQYDNDINTSFVDSYTNAYGIVPDLFTSGTFTAASAIDQAVKQGGSTEPDDIASQLRGMTVKDTPKGKNAYEFQTYNNQARSAMTVADVVPTSDEWSGNWDAAVMPSKPVTTISKGETTIPKSSSQMNCSL